MKAQLETKDLLDALATFRDRYHAVDVFADDLSNSALEDVERGEVSHDGQAYRFDVFPEHGVVRLERLREAGQGNSANHAVAGAALGAVVAAAAKQRGEGILGGALLGLLVGSLLNTPEKDARPARRIFAMELDPRTRTWTAYDGGLLRWMKSRLLPPESQATKKPSAA